MITVAQASPALSIPAVPSYVWRLVWREAATLFSIIAVLALAVLL